MSRSLRSKRAGMGFVLVLVACFISTSSTAFGQNRYFPTNTPFVLPNGVTVQSYGNAFTQFDREVTDNVKNLNAGMIRFDYNTWNRAGNPSPGGGGALTGGFFMADGITVKPGFALHWVQIVGRDTTTNGANDWGFDPQNQNGPFPDADATTPVYPYESLLPGVNPNPAPTLGFTDFPARTYAGPSGLVCRAGTHLHCEQSGTGRLPGEPRDRLVLLGVRSHCSSRWKSHRPV